MLVGVDLDGVVADFTTPVQGWVHRKYGIEPIPITKWEWFEDWPDGKRIWRRLWSEAVPRDHLFLSCPVIPGAKDGVNWMLERGYDVGFVTHRPESAHNDTRRWLTMHGWSSVPVFYMKDKSWLNADLFIDDYDVTVRDLRNANRRALLFSQTWNLHASDLDPVRCLGWKDVIRCVEYIGG